MSKAKIILLVDDDEDDHELFTEAVGEIDKALQCYCSHNGEEALKWLSANNAKLPDLIFLDLNMPRMNGMQFLAAIKKVKELRDIPVVIYTTSSLSDDKKNTAMLGAKHFITKPTTFNKICQAIEGIFSTEWGVKYGKVRQK